MIRQNQRIINFLNICSDFCLVLFSYFVALMLRFDILDGVVTLQLSRGGFAIGAVAYSVAIVIAYYALRLYGSYRFKHPGEECITILLINGMGTLVYMAVLFLFRIVDFSRMALVLFWLISSGLVICKRTFVRMILRHYRALGYNQKHVAIVGNGHLAHQYLLDLEQKPHLGFTVDGYVSKMERPELGTCLGSYEQLEEILENYELDELVVALEPHEVRFMKDVLSVADKEGIRVNLIPFYNDYIPTHPTIEVVGKTKLINLRATPLDHLGWAMVKRVVDVIGALVLLILTSPLLLVTAIGVKLSSPGPIFFRQKRIGKDKKPFDMLKFRSMRTDIDHTGWSVANDPRKTKFGTFIRKYSIDELPQLLNVLIGDMSLVGPRPEIPRYVRQFKEEIPLYLVRQQVRPGMTGWAQVNGLRGDTSIEDRVEYDIWYIENWSFWLDIKILFMTAFGGFINKEEVKKPEEKQAETSPVTIGGSTDE